MKKTIFTMVAVATLAVGQQTEAERKAMEAEKKALAAARPPRAQKVFQVKHANVGRAFGPPSITLPTSG